MGLSLFQLRTFKCVCVLWKTVVALPTMKVVWLSIAIYLYTCVCLYNAYIHNCIKQQQQQQQLWKCNVIFDCKAKCSEMKEITHLRWAVQLQLSPTVNVALWHSHLAFNHTVFIQRSSSFHFQNLLQITVLDVPFRIIATGIFKYKLFKWPKCKSLLLLSSNNRIQ